MTLPPVHVAPPELPPAEVLPSSHGSGSATPSLSPSPCKENADRNGEGFGCLNQKLKDQVNQANPGLTTPSAPIDAKSSDLKVGVVNVPAVQQQYGKNFGISAVPFRPGPMIFSPPLGRH